MKQKNGKKAAKAEISPALIARARAGEAQAFTELYEQTSPAVYRAIRAMVRDEDLTWDLLQETYLRAFRSLDRLEAEEAFLPWLRRIAVNETARRMADPRPLTFTELGGEEGDLPELPDPDPGSQPEPALDRKETARLVREILEALPPQQHLIVGMRYYEDLSIQEIADLLQLAPGTVKAQLHLGRKKVETRVRALEAQGVKLWGLSPVAFLTALLRRLEPAAEPEGQALKAVLAGTPAAETTITAMTAGQAFFHGFAAKAAAGVLAAALIGGGIWAGSRYLNSRRQAVGDERPPETGEAVIMVTPEPADPADPETTAEIPSAEPTEPDETPGIPAEPADPETEAAIRALFADPRGWYCRALTSEYPETMDADLGRLFRGGIPGLDNSLSEGEREALRSVMGDTADGMDGNIVRVPAFAAGPCAGTVTTELFGTSLDGFAFHRGAEKGDLLGEDWWYLPEYDCYYHFYEEDDLRPIEILAVSVEDGGQALVRYRSTDGTFPETMSVVLQPEAGGYRILANIRCDGTSVLEDPAAPLRARLEALVSDPGSWYARALTSRFRDTAELDLYQLFYAGIPGVDDALTEAERAGLIAQNPWMEAALETVGCDRLPRAEMDRILTRYFWRGLDRFTGRGLEHFAYLPEADCYYHLHGDTNLMGFHVEAVRQLPDGTILFTYRSAWLWPGRETVPLWTVALRSTGFANYQIVSNLPGEWITAEDLGELGALYGADTVWEAETDADGTGKVRELTLRAEGSLSYRERVPGAGETWLASGSWWTEDGQTLRLELWEVDADGNRIGPTSLPAFACTLADGELVLTQAGEAGFRGDEAGTVLRFTPQSPADPEGD